MPKLKDIVDVLCNNKQWFENYYTQTAYEPYGIQKDCLAADDYDSGLRLLDVCFGSRQGGQTKKPIKEYEKVTCDTVAQVFAILKGNNSPDERISRVLHILSKIEGVGSKISSVYLKMLVIFANSAKTRELEHALPVPLDRHLQNFLFSEVKEDEWTMPNRFNIFSEKVNGANLSLKFDKNGNAKGRFFEIQDRLRQLFANQKIMQPIVILDNLWVAGRVYCNNVRVSQRISCDRCMFGDLKDDAGEPVCGRQRQF